MIGFSRSSVSLHHSAAIVATHDRLKPVTASGGAITRATSVDTGQVGCAENHRGVPGHPFSGRPNQQDRNADFPTCSLTPVPNRPGVFDLKLTGIDYAQQQFPSKDSTGKLLPADQSALASGSVWFRVATSESTSVTLTMDDHTYRAPTGQQATDRTGNNSSNKNVTVNGSWTARWNRAYTHSAGTAWDDTYRVAAGTVVREQVNSNFRADNVAAAIVARNSDFFMAILLSRPIPATMMPCFGHNSNGIEIGDRGAWG